MPSSMIVYMVSISRNRRTVETGSHLVDSEPLVVISNGCSVSPKPSPVNMHAFQVARYASRWCNPMDKKGVCESEKRCRNASATTSPLSKQPRADTELESLRNACVYGMIRGRLRLTSGFTNETSALSQVKRSQRIDEMQVRLRQRVNMSESEGKWMSCKTKRVNGRKFGGKVRGRFQVGEW